MNITTIKDKMNMTNEQNIKQPMQDVELGIIMNVAKKPHLIDSLNRYINHPLKTKYSHLPFRK